MPRWAKASNEKNLWDRFWPKAWAILAIVIVAWGLPVMAHAGTVVIHIADAKDSARLEAARNIQALLESDSHRVTITDRYANRPLSDNDRAELARFDVMIFPRLAGASSTVWSEEHGWPAVDVPMLISSGLIAQEWGLGEQDQYRRYTNLTAPAALRVLQADHPILADVSINARGNIFIGSNPKDTFNEFWPIRHKGASPRFTQLLTAAYGEAVSDDATLTSLAVWEPGSIKGVTTRRIFLDMQSEDDLNAGDEPNMDVLSDNMKQVYLNAVKYLIPQQAGSNPKPDAAE